jgi:hypothetical protein
VWGEEGGSWGRDAKGKAEETLPAAARCGVWQQKTRPAHKHIGPDWQVKITDLLTSAVFAEFNELRQADLPAALEATNWFSIAFVTRVHMAYIQLDADQDGLLSRDELLNLDGGCLCEALVDRIFQEHRT